MNRRSFIRRLASVPLASAFQVAAPPGKVKITGFDIHKVSVRWRDLMFVEVHTDAGITGLGEATLESRTDIAESVLRWLEPEYVGLDPAGPEAHWDRVYYIATRPRMSDVTGANQLHQQVCITGSTLAGRLKLQVQQVPDNRGSG